MKHHLPGNFNLVFVICLLLIILGLKAPAQVPCTNPPLMSLNASWKVQSTVHVVIDPQFGFNSSNQKQLILQQLDKWGNTGVANVTFLDKSNGGAGPGSGPGTNPILFISKALPDAPGAQGQEQGISYGGCRGDTEIKINPGVTDPTAFIQVVSHEIGHTFGLQHCNCPQNSTAMTLPASASLNAAGGYDGPTSCDIDKFRICGTLPTPTPTPEQEPPFGCTYPTFNGACPYGTGRQVGDPYCCVNFGCGEPPPCPAVGNYDAQECNMHYSGTGGGWDECDCTCKGPDSPILIDILGDGFSLSNSGDGVSFDIDAAGGKEQISWTTFGSDDAWLALDRNANSMIDNGEELFGNHTDQPRPPLGKEKQGFLALAEYDKFENGGNSDGLISSEDLIFQNLKLWQDKNHNGISEVSELHNLLSLNIAKLELNYHESKRTDEHGNQFKYRAKVKDAKDSKVGRWAWDVFLVTAP